PSGSVPSRSARDPPPCHAGGRSRCVTSDAVGSYRVITGANRAAATTRTRNARLNGPLPRRSVRHSRRRARGTAGGGPTRTPAARASIRATAASAQLDAGIEPDVAEVDEEVHHDEHQGDEEYRRGNRGEI